MHCSSFPERKKWILKDSDDTEKRGKQSSSFKGADLQPEKASIEMIRCLSGGS